MRYAVIKNNKVINVIVSDAQLNDTYVKSDSANIGDTYIKGKFTNRGKVGNHTKFSKTTVKLPRRNK